MGNRNGGAAEGSGHEAGAGSAGNDSRLDLARIKQRLLERLDELRADIRRELGKYENEHYNMLAESVADPGEQSVADLLVDVDLAEISRDVAEVRDVEAALMRLARGVYGICVDCESRIEDERLEYEPSAARCIPCQQRFERRDRQEKHRTL